MSGSRQAVCATCRHSARGEAIDIRPKGRRGHARPSLRGGDYICARDGLVRPDADPVTGFVPLPSGPDCRDLNPDGECPHYRRAVSTATLFLVLVLVAAAAALALEAAL